MLNGHYSHKEVTTGDAKVPYLFLLPPLPLSWSLITHEIPMDRTASSLYYHLALTVVLAFPRSLLLWPHYTHPVSRLCPCSDGRSPLPKTPKELKDLLYDKKPQTPVSKIRSFQWNTKMQLNSLMKRYCDNFVLLATKPRSHIKNEKKGCDFHSLPGKLLPSASPCHSPSAPRVLTSCFFSSGGSYKEWFAPENSLEWCNYITSHYDCIWHSAYSQWYGHKLWNHKWSPG